MTTEMLEESRSLQVHGGDGPLGHAHRLRARTNVATCSSDVPSSAPVSLGTLMNDRAAQDVNDLASRRQVLSANTICPMSELYMPSKPRRRESDCLRMVVQDV